MNSTNPLHIGQSRKDSFTWIDYSLFIITIIACISISFYFGRKQSTVDRYLTGRKKMKSFPIALSLISYNVSALSLFGMPADIYKYGATQFLTPLSLLMTGLAMIYIFLPVFYHLQLTSVYEYLKHRFDNRTRVLGSFLYLFDSFLIIPIVVYVPSLGFSNISGIDIKIIVFSILGVCILYTAIGGLESVIWIDVFQNTITVASIVVILILGTISENGVTNVVKKAINSERLDILDFDFDPTKRDSFWITVFGLAIILSSPLCVYQTSMQKCLTLPTFRNSVLAIIYFVICMVIFKLAITFVGLLIYSKYADCDPLSTGEIRNLDELVPFYFMNVVRQYAGFPGITFAGVLVSSMSTLSTELNGMAGVIYKDFVLNCFPKKASKLDNLMILKMTVVLCGLIITSLVFVVGKVEGMFQLGLSVSAICSAPLFAIFTMGIMIPRVNSKGAFYSGILGVILGSSLVLPSKYYQFKGLFSHPSKPLSTNSCELYNVAVEKNFVSNHSLITENPSAAQPFVLFRISFYIHALIIYLLTIFLGIIISCITRPKYCYVDKKLIHPFCHRFLPKETTSDDYQNVRTSLVLEKTTED